jgi:putative nucleotidyltransferase with HDIG domain
MSANDKNSEFEFIQGLTAELSSKNLVFPTSLNATMKIRRALNNADISNDQVARLISAEPVLSAQVLKLANSAMFNRTDKRVVDLRSAVLALGFSVVRNVAISVGMKQLKENEANGQSAERMEGLWKRSLRVAALAFVLARNFTKISPDKAMITGLLHDVGKFYILNRASHYQDLFVTEAAIWGVVDHWHVDIGAAILENWEMPEDVCQAVMNHRTSELSTSNRASLTDVIAAANFLDAHFVARSIKVLDWNSVPASLHNLQLDLPKCEQLMDDTKDELNLIFQELA